MRLIDADALNADFIQRYTANADVYLLVRKILNDAPAVDAVHRETLEQAMWERNVAMGQLEEHGIPFGCKADVQAVVRCKDCRYYFHFGKTSLLVDGKNVKAGWCQRRIRYDAEHRMIPTDFCSYGERKE